MLGDYHVIIAAAAARGGGTLQLSAKEIEAVVGMSMDIDFDDEGNAKIRVYQPSESVQ